MSPDERSRFDAANAATRLALDVGEKVRDARERAGLSSDSVNSQHGWGRAKRPSCAMRRAALVRCWRLFRRSRQLSTSRSRSNSHPPGRKCTYENNLRASAWFSTDTR